MFTWFMSTKIPFKQFWESVVKMTEYWARIGAEFVEYLPSMGHAYNLRIQEL